MPRPSAPTPAVSVVRYVLFLIYALYAEQLGSILHYNVHMYMYVYVYSCLAPAIDSDLKLRKYLAVAWKPPCSVLYYLAVEEFTCNIYVLDFCVILLCDSGVIDFWLRLSML